jgi:thiamine-monophosphate kinase
LKTSLSESAIVRRIERRFADVLAPGALDLVDDAALLPRPAKGQRRVVSTDQCVEGVHFDEDLAPLDSAGWRAVVRNVSDLAGMQTYPVGFVWSLALPASWLEGRARRLDAFLKGAAKAAERFGMPLYGGDVTTTQGPFVCSITAFGDAPWQPRRRSTAKVGDQIVVSHRLGAASAGLALLREGTRTSRKRGERAALDAYRYPFPGAVSPGARDMRACMDISDGLILDLDRLCRASGVGAELSAEGLRAAVHEGAGDAGGIGLERALYGGDDYALLYTVSARMKVDRALVIGRISERKGIYEVSGAGGGRGRIPVRGWDPFARGATAG